MLNTYLYGSTDISVVENEIVYVHFANNGITHCYFLGIIACKNGDAHGIYDAIMKALIFQNIASKDILKKMVAFIGDGASVNTGKFNGVISIFQRNVNKSILMVKCMSHRVELAFKQAMSTSTLFKKVMSWQTINNLFRVEFPNILGVVDLMLLLPAGTSECERGFPQMKATKTQYRNKLKSSTMPMLMTIQMHSPSVSEFDPIPSIHQWNRHHHRKPSFMEGQRRKKLSAIQAVDEAVEQQRAANALDEEEVAKAETDGDAHLVAGLDSDYGSDFSDLAESNSDTDV
ncbi:uncharacterized protein LOC144359973 [Saccoglossus kowalevskii]